ncbi:hypothetical protein [Paraherbaspirillum soli]|uniref:Uncharacterized protein n=1 Tax=Paraherbaspirillum soli TaxID=631222 RepID=A0ABW0M7Z7_9BURK
MSTHVIEAVRFNAAGDRVEQVRWGRVIPTNGGPLAWDAKTSEQDVSLVVDALNFGDEVLTVFAVGPGTVLGPRVQVVIHEHGVEGIATVGHDMPGRTLSDLPRF